MVVWALGEWNPPDLRHSLLLILSRRVMDCMPQYDSTVRRNMLWALKRIFTKGRAGAERRRRAGEAAAERMLSRSSGATGVSVARTSHPAGSNRGGSGQMTSYKTLSAEPTPLGGERMPPAGNTSEGELLLAAEAAFEAALTADVC
jgi:hypothetical protein